MIKWDQIPEFSRHEFDDPEHPGSGDLFNEVAFYKLLDLRRKTGWPIVTHVAVGGAVDVGGTHGHAKGSYHGESKGFCAVDFHFITDAGTREQYQAVAESGFPGIGVYYDWHWNGKLLPIGFHVDDRPKDKAQRWTRKAGKYLYFLK